MLLKLLLTAPFIAVHAKHLLRFSWLMDEENLTDKCCRPYKGRQIRFSDKIKETVADQRMVDKCFPLGPKSYPLSEELMHFLGEFSKSTSVIRPDDYEATQSIQEITKIIGKPTHAPWKAFWPDFENVLDAQLARRQKTDSLASEVFPKFPLPKLWIDKTVGEVAEAVHDEYPGHWQSRLLEYFGFGNLPTDNNIIPKRANTQFLHGPVMLADLNTWAITTVSPTSFNVKWGEGRARPEEVAWRIRNGFFGKRVPSSIKYKVLDMNLKSAVEFTAYPEGAPKHPSYPAMHSASSAMSVWLPVVVNLTPEQLEETKIMDLGVAYARTVAGVHYQTDNISGLKLGQEVIVKELPRYLATKYGADPIKVIEKIKTVMFDWDVEVDRLIGPSSTATSRTK